MKHIFRYLQAAIILSPVLFAGYLYSWEASVFDDGFNFGCGFGTNLWLSDLKYSSNFSSNKTSTLCRDIMKNKWSTSIDGGYYFDRKHELVVGFEHFSITLKEKDFANLERKLELNSGSIGYRRFLQFEDKTLKFADISIAYYNGGVASSSNAPKLGINAYGINLYFTSVWRLLDPLFMGFRVGYGVGYFSVNSSSSYENRDYRSFNHRVEIHPMIEVNFLVIIREIEKAIDALRKGSIVALPTDTFYSLSVVYDNLQGLESLVEIKETSNPLLLLIPSISHLELVTRDIHPLWLRWLDMVWPSAITFLFPASDDLLPIITLGTNKVGVRVPNNTDLLNLLFILDKPVTGTSANPQGLPQLQNPGRLKHTFPILSIYWNLRELIRQLLTLS